MYFIILIPNLLKLICNLSPRQHISMLHAQISILQGMDITISYRHPNLCAILVVSECSCSVDFHYIHSGNFNTDARSLNVNGETPATVYYNTGAEDGKWESLVRFHK